MWRLPRLEKQRALGLAEHFCGSRSLFPIVICSSMTVRSWQEPPQAAPSCIPKASSRTRDESLSPEAELRTSVHAREQVTSATAGGPTRAFADSLDEFPYRRRRKHGGLGSRLRGAPTVPKRDREDTV